MFRHGETSCDGFLDYLVGYGFHRFDGTHTLHLQGKSHRWLQFEFWSKFSFPSKYQIVLAFRELGGRVTSDFRSPVASGIIPNSQPRGLNLRTLWLQYPSATNTCPEIATATAVGWQSSVWPPGWNGSPMVRIGCVSPGWNYNRAHVKLLACLTKYCDLGRVPGG